MPTTIILAAGSVSEKLPFLKSRCSSPALIPVNTRPLAAYIIEFYRKQADNSVYLAVDSAAVGNVTAELGGLIPSSCQILPIGRNNGVVDTLEESLDLAQCGDDIIVNLVTTVPVVFVGENEVILSAETTQSCEWSGIRREAAATEFCSKNNPESRASNAFTGVFRASRATLKEAIRQTTKRNDLLAVVEQLHQISELSFRLSEWIDCGHETNYYDAKSKLISARSFNMIRVSLEDGVVTKSSQDSPKIQREAAFIQMLPQPISVYFPRTLLHHDSQNILQTESEYYGYPTVAEYYLYWELSSENWRRLFGRLGRILQRFRSYPYSISRTAFTDFYLHKTTARVEQYWRTVPPSLRQALESDVRVNGHLCRPFSRLLPDLALALDDLYHERDFCIMHGDFCFSNMLHDIVSGIVRLIDPRGSFGDSCVGIYGDHKYDLAKLMHSAEYGYDRIVNGLYSLSMHHSDFDLSLAARDCHNIVSCLARELIAEAGQSQHGIDLITSLLFLSMCPLHADDSRRQLSMYIHGLQLLNQSLR